MANPEYDEGSYCQCFCDARGDPRGISRRWHNAQVLSVSLSYRPTGRRYQIKFVSGINSNDRFYSATDLRPMPADDAAPPRKRARTEGTDEAAAPAPSPAPAPVAPPAPAPAPRAIPAPTAAAPDPPAEAGGQKNRFKGVRWGAKVGKWRAEIQVRGHKIPLGNFDVEEDAARAYDAARAKWAALHSCKGPLNFPDEAPLASALAALPPLPWQIDPAPLPPRRRSAPPPPPTGSRVAVRFSDGVDQCEKSSFALAPLMG